MRGEAKRVDLTEGNILTQLLRFALPMLLSNVFQQMYNMVDSIIVGQFIGKDALAAVGSSANIIMLIQSLFFGICMGAGVIIARYNGAKDHDGVQRAIHTMVSFGILGGIIIVTLGETLTPTILNLMGTPDSVLTEAVVYFRIYFFGAFFHFLYAIGAGVLTAVGDSKRPLYFLITASVLNVFVDLLFVAELGFGIRGTAWATVLSQILSFILAYRALLVKDKIYTLDLKKLKFHKNELKEIITIGLPNGFQNSVISISNVLLQSSINAFGATALAGYAAYTKIDGFALMPAGAFSMALTTYVSSNVGAGKFDRVKKGAKRGFLLSVLTAETMGIILYFFSPVFLRIFTSDPGIIECGRLQASIVAPFYFLCAGTHSFSGMLRGVGRSTLPMLVTAIFWCGFRILWVPLVCLPKHVLALTYWAYPITWTMTFVILGTVIINGRWIKKAEAKYKTTDTETL